MSPIILPGTPRAAARDARDAAVLACVDRGIHAISAIARELGLHAQAVSVASRRLPMCEVTAYRDIASTRTVQLVTRIGAGNPDPTRYAKRWSASGSIPADIEAVLASGGRPAREIAAALPQWTQGSVKHAVWYLARAGRLVRHPAVGRTPPVYTLPGQELPAQEPTRVVEADEEDDAPAVPYVNPIRARALGLAAPMRGAA